MKQHQGPVPEPQQTPTHAADNVPDSEANSGGGLNIAHMHQLMGADAFHRMMCSERNYQIWRKSHSAYVKRMERLAETRRLRRQQDEEELQALQRQEEETKEEPLQGKFTVNDPHDKSEQEADQVAEVVESNSVPPDEASQNLKYPVIVAVLLTTVSST